MTNQPRSFPRVLRREASRAFVLFNQRFTHRRIFNDTVSELEATEFFRKALQRRIESPLKRSALTRAERSLPINPLGGSQELLPEIDIAITAHQKDFGWLPLVLRAAVENSLNPISRIRIITPPGPIPNLPKGLRAQIEAESELLGAETLSRIAEIASPGRFGWILQQVIKFYTCLTTGTRATLVIDADTVLLNPKVWLSSEGVQALSPSIEYHRPYVLQTESHWGEIGSPHGVSYVTHHQLLQKVIVEEMFPQGLNSIVNWASNIDPTQPSAISEYHSYGTFLSNAHPDRISWARWANAIDFGATTEYTSTKQLRARFPWAESVSFHSYFKA